MFKPLKYIRHKEDGSVATILDIGAGEGNTAKAFKDNNLFSVTSIDPGLLEAFQIDESITLPISFEDFNTESDTYSHPRYFDYTLCINVFPFMKDQKAMMYKMFATADVCIFNVWGECNELNKSGRANLERAEIDEFLDSIEATHDVVYFNESEYEGPTQASPHKLFHWHTFDIVMKKK